MAVLVWMQQLTMLWCSGRSADTAAVHLQPRPRVPNLTRPPVLTSSLVAASVETTLAVQRQPQATQSNYSKEHTVLEVRTVELL